MTHLLVDTLVLIKWFHSEGEGELPEARSLLAAHVAGELDAHVLDLAMYEVGNVLIRALRWDAADVANQLDDLGTIVGSATHAVGNGTPAKAVHRNNGPVWNV